jgi:hypothetical protein
MEDGEASINIKSAACPSDEDSLAGFHGFREPKFVHKAIMT